MQITTRVVTPQIAAEWIQTIEEGRQRKMRMAHVTRLAGIIERGEWSANNDMIMLDIDGRLINGQHRCAAIVKANRPVSAVVALGCDPNLYKVIDHGTAPRHNADALHVAGYSSYLNIAAIINTIYRDIKGKNIPSATEAIEFAQANKQKLLDAHAWWRRCVESKSPIEPSIVCALWFFAVAQYPIDANNFCAAIADSACAKGDAAWVLLKRFREDRASVSRLPRRVKMALAVRAFRSWRMESSPRFLRWNTSEPFPAL